MFESERECSSVQCQPDCLLISNMQQRRSWVPGRVKEIINSLRKFLNVSEAGRRALRYDVMPKKVITFQYEKFSHPAMKTRWESWDGKINFNDLNASIPQLSSQVPVFSSMSFRVLDFWVHYKKLLFFAVCVAFLCEFFPYLKENQSRGIICERARERKNKLYLQKMVSKFTGWRKVGVGMWKEEKKRSSNAKWTSLINRNEAFFIHWRN